MRWRGGRRAGGIQMGRKKEQESGRGRQKRKKEREENEQKNRVWDGQMRSRRAGRTKKEKKLFKHTHLERGCRGRGYRAV